MKKEAMLYEKQDGNTVHCILCAHECKIKESRFGICGVRQNRDGTLYSLVYGKALAVNVDPIEKKPLYHFLPGSRSYSIATAGCNFQCGFCQNWSISQVSRENNAYLPGQDLPPAQVVENAQKNNCLSISYTYTEPTIYFEYAYDTARLAKEAGIKNVFVTNGYMTTGAIDTIAPFLDAANVDLKAFSEEYYRRNCKSSLQPVLESIAYMKKHNIWVEVTTLVIPIENDSEQELNQIAAFIANISIDIPWHISRFHPDYKFSDHNVTPMETLRRAYEIGKKFGLRYVYLGNVLEETDTRCFNCGQTLVRRRYMGIEQINLKNGSCPSCETIISGVWQ